MLWERNPQHITFAEALLYVWIAAFACDELGEFRDAGTMFYSSDFWSLWDIGIVTIGGAYLISSKLQFLRHQLCAIDVRLLSLGSIILQLPLAVRFIALHEPRLTHCKQS